MKRLLGGPHLCVDLKATGLTPRNRLLPRLGQQVCKVCTATTKSGSPLDLGKLDVYGFGAAPFYQDIEHPENERGLAYPDMYRNPLEVFK